MEILNDKSYYGKSGVARWGVADDQMTMTQKWLCFVALFLFATFSLYQNLIMAPCLADVAAALGMQAANMGWIMSIFTVAGLILAYPATWIMQNFGIKSSVVVSGILSLLGNVVCLVSGNAPLFMAGRLLQGCGFGLITVLGPNIMPRLMPMNKMGLTMGIWSQWVVPGTALSALTTAGIFASFGWRALFVASIIYLAITMVLVLVFVKMPLVPENVLYGAQAAPSQAKASSTPARKSYPISAMLVGFVFFAWCFQYGCYNSFYPTFAQTAVQMDMFGASMTTFVAALATIPTGIFFGWLADRIEIRKIMLLAGLAITAVFTGFVLWRVQSVSGAYIASVFIGLVCAGIVPTMTRSIIPVLAVSPKTTDWALTSMAFVTCLANAVSGFAPGIGIAHGFGAVGYLVGGIMLVAFVLMLFIKDDRKLEE